MSQLVAPGEQPLRADARRNREKVLAAARAVFSEHGRDAQMDDVARRAGVGVGTVYRHFPTKEALIEALMVAAFETIAEAAEAALEIEDPWEAFTIAAVDGRRDRWPATGRSARCSRASRARWSRRCRPSRG